MSRCKNISGGNISATLEMTL